MVPPLSGVKAEHSRFRYCIHEAWTWWTALAPKAFSSEVRAVASFNLVQLGLSAPIHRYL
jgi:hypothetical protein